MHARMKRIPIVIFLLAAAAGAGWWYLRQQDPVSAESGLLSASGTIEASQVLVAPEIGGKVLDVLVDEAESVQAGQALVRFSDALLGAQLAQARATVAQAEANYTLAAAGMPDEQQALAVAAANLEVISAQQALDELHAKNELAAAQAAKTVADTRDLVRDAQRIYDSLSTPASENDIEIAQSLVTLSDEALKRAEKRFKTLLKKAETNPKRAAAQLLVSVLEKQHDLAVKRLNYLEGTADEITLAQAEANLELAQASLEDAEQELEDLADGPDPDVLELAEARLAAAQAKLAAAQAGPSAEQLALARAQVDVARAAIGVIQIQMDKLTLVAPTDGVVLSRSIEAGEVVIPGTTVLTLVKPEELKITVYISEDRYGVIQLGGAARVTVDSFPGQDFEANVVKIADQAEFTPRNVQTEEGRSTTVYAVVLQVKNPDGRLKPGMPADVEFIEG